MILKVYVSTTAKMTSPGNCEDFLIIIDWCQYTRHATRDVLRTKREWYSKLRAPSTRTCMHLYVMSTVESLY